MLFVVSGGVAVAMLIAESAETVSRVRKLRKNGAVWLPFRYQTAAVPK